MGDIRMTTEMRTDFDCETTGMPAERWAEAVFTAGQHELVIEVSVEQDIIVAVMAGDGAVWKGTWEGFRQLLQSAISKS